MNSFIARSYKTELNPADLAYLYLDHSGEGSITVMRESDGLYPDPECSIRYRIPATATLAQVEKMFADMNFQNCCYSLCNIKDSGHDWRVLGELFMLIIHRHLPGFDIHQDGELGITPELDI